MYAEGACMAGAHADDSCISMRTHISISTKDTLLTDADDSCEHIYSYEDTYIVLARGHIEVLARRTHILLADADDSCERRLGALL